MATKKKQAVEIRTGSKLTEQERNELQKLQALFDPEQSLKRLDDFTKWMFTIAATVGTLGAGFANSAFSTPTTWGQASLAAAILFVVTVGHSITLVLATFGWIGSPGWVEPAIAVSIGIAAWLNLYPLRWVRNDAVALGFGLIHGLGFSSAIREANISQSLLPWALAGFNLGVEAGQLVGVALWCGLQLALVRHPWYERVVVRGGSWVLLLLAGFWAIQRTAVM